MSDPSSSPAPPALWRALKSFLKPAGSLRESLEEAIEEHVEARAAADDLDADEREMLKNMLTASEARVGDIATPRSDIVALDIGTPFDQAVATFCATGHTRLPLFEDTLDTVVGMLHLKDLFAILADPDRAGPPPALATLRRELLFVPPSMPVLDVLAEMRRKRTHMAIVVDEFGGTDGLVTFEDAVEEIVGEIEDEHDEAVAEPLLAMGETFEADARIPLEDLAQRLDIPFADEAQADEVDTLGGLVVLLAGRVPTPGERIAHPNGWTLEVTAGDDRRIERLRLHPPTGDPAG
jgi:CBS domain containing-hemolysin-like protein